MTVEPERWARLREQGEQAFQRLATEVTVGGERFALAHAGRMGDRVRFGIFPRDLLITGLIGNEVNFLHESVRFCAATIGRQRDPRTGEEPGRVLHEFDPYTQDGLSTRYNACETSHLFLIGGARCLAAGFDLRAIGDELRAAGEYVLRHIEDDLFWEDPRRAGAERYLLRATYWKDSFLPGRRELRFPVAYALVQAQTVAALRALGRLSQALDLGFDPGALAARARAVVAALWDRLWDPNADYLALAWDGGELVPGVSSDGLHLLAYLRPEDVPPAKLDSIRRRASELATPYGFRTYAPGQPDYSPTGYHQGAIWPYEQWFIAQGAVVHGLVDVLSVAERVLAALEALGFVELFYWQDELRGPGVVPGEGCDLQLWSTVVPEGFVRLRNGGEGGAL